MPTHDWLQVDAGIYHHFHQSWIGCIARALNDGLLPGNYYALKEQFAAGLGPDVLTLQATATNGRFEPQDFSHSGGGTALAPPKIQPVAETDLAYYRKKQNLIAIRHVSDDRVVSIVEIVSPGNKAAQYPFDSLVKKAAEFIEAGIHLLLIDLFPPGRRDPQGVHAAIWKLIADEGYSLLETPSLTLASYESGSTLRAYVLHPAVGDALPDMPLFIEPGLTVSVPLEATYCDAFDELPKALAANPFVK